MKRKHYVALLTLLLAGLGQSAFADYPIASHRFLADPGAMVHDGRVYLYCSNDDDNPPDEEGYRMTSIVCVSSSDLKNWTDHGVVFEVPRDASWLVGVGLPPRLSGMANSSFISETEEMA